MPRSSFLDAYRGTAVLLMMIFHFCWDLLNFGFVHYSLHDPFWVDFRRVIVTLFLTAVGWSAYLSMKKHGSWFLWKRDGKLFTSAAAISLATYLAFPDKWIFFGILHFIFLATLIVRPLSKWPFVSTFIGSAILILYNTTTWLHFPNAFMDITQYLHLPHKTLDILFPLPWIGVVLIGPILGYLNLHRCTLSNHYPIRFLTFLGRHALPIYMVHQLFLFALVATAKTVLDWLS